MDFIARARCLGLFSILLTVTAARSGDLPLSDGDRIVIEGDSGADAKKWSCYLADYLILMNPSLNLHIQVLARGGTAVESALDDPTGYHGYDEYHKLTASMQPRYVFVNYGVNGGDTTDQFIAAMTDLTDNYVVAGNNAIPIMIGPQPLPRRDGPAHAVASMRMRETTLAAIRGWQKARIWHDLLSIWTNPDNWPLLSETGDVHPDTSGHILIAHSIIKMLGFSTVVAKSTIKASNRTVTSQTNCTVSNVTANANGGIDFDRLDTKLPWTVDDTQDGYNKAVIMRPEVANWQDYSIKVTKLSAGTYDILCDGTQIGSTISATTLGAGWNMADLHTGPVYAQVQEVLGRIRDMLGVDRVTLANVGPPWRGVYKYKSNAGAYYGDGQRGATLLASLQPAITEVNNYDALIHTAAQPVTRHYSIRLSGSPSPTPTATPTPTPTRDADPNCDFKRLRQHQLRPQRRAPEIMLPQWAFRILLLGLIRPWICLPTGHTISALARCPIQTLVMGLTLITSIRRARRPLTRIMCTAPLIAPG